MPVARIITRTPQDAELIAGQLRARGYAVEIAAPGVPQRGSASLEINLDACDPEEALHRAGELAKAGADVFVTAGTFSLTEAPASREQQQHAVASVEPAQHPAWQPEPQTASEHSSLMRDLVNVAGPAFMAAAHRLRELTVAGARGACALTFSALAAARDRMGDAVADVNVYFARRSEQRRRAQQQRQPQQARTQRTMVSTAVSRPKPQPQPARLPVIRRTRSRDYEWKTAGMFSLALAIGITLAWAAANQHPATPVPASVVMRSNSVQQQVPFGPVTLPAPAKPSRQAAPRTKPSASKPAVATQPRPNTLGDEVVVRHFTRPRSEPPSRPAVAAKRIVVND